MLLYLEIMFYILVLMMPQLKDLFISYLRRHTMDQLASMEFQLKSKRELALEINKMLNSGNIDSIYYSGFFIQ